MPFLSGDLPFVSEVVDAAVRAEAEAGFDVFHEGLGGEASGSSEAGAVDYHGLIAETDAAKEDAEFVEDFDEQSAGAGWGEALAEDEKGDVRMGGDGGLEVG